MLSDAICFSLAILRGSRGCVRGSCLGVRWLTTRWPRRTCRAGDQRPIALAAIAGGVHLPACRLARPQLEMMMHVHRASALGYSGASSYETAPVYARRFPCRAELAMAAS